LSWGVIIFMRCFIAIDLNKEIKKKISEFQSSIKDTALRMVSPENLHITLLFLGEQSNEEIGRIDKHLKHISFQPFTIKIQGLGVFPNENLIRVLWLGIESPELIALARDIHKSLGKKYDFSAHLTIARAKGKLDRETTKKINKEIEIGCQEVSSFRLKKSTLTPSGPVYEDVFAYNSI